TVLSCAASELQSAVAPRVTIEMTSRGSRALDLISLFAPSRRGATLSVPARSLRDVQHPLQRHPGPLGGVRVDGDAVHDPTLDEVLKHPGEMGRVDPEH